VRHAACCVVKIKLCGSHAKRRREGFFTCRRGKKVCADALRVAGAPDSACEAIGGLRAPAPFGIRGCCGEAGPW
jgi:hypothetical protein